MNIKADFNNVLTGYRITRIIGQEADVMAVARAIWRDWYKDQDVPHSLYQLPSVVGHFGDDFICTGEYVDELDFSQP